MSSQNAADDGGTRTGALGDGLTQPSFSSEVDNTSLSVSVSEVCQGGDANAQKHSINNSSQSAFSDVSQKSSRSNSQNASVCHSPRLEKATPGRGNASMLNRLTPRTSTRKRESSKDVSDLLNEVISAAASDGRLSGDKRLSGEARFSSASLRMPYSTPPDPSASASDDGGEMSSASSTASITHRSTSPKKKPRAPSGPAHSASSRHSQAVPASKGLPDAKSMQTGGDLSSDDDASLCPQSMTRANTLDVVECRSPETEFDKLQLSKSKFASAPPECAVEEACSDRESESSASDAFSNAFGGVAFEESVLSEDLQRPSNTTFQAFSIIEVLRSKPPEYDTRRKGGRSREDMKKLFQLLQMSNFYSSVGRTACESACSMMELVEVNAGATIYTKGSAIDALFILLDGEVEQYDETWSTLGTLLFSDSLPRLQTLQYGETLMSGGTVNARTAVCLASIPCKYFVELWRKAEHRLLDFSTAVKIVRETEPARRTSNDVANIVKYLRWLDVFSCVSDNVLQNVARELGFDEFSGGHVVALEGSRPENMLIVVSGKVAAWRLVRRSARTSRRLQHFELNTFEHSNDVGNVIMLARNPEETHHAASPTETNRKHVCIDVTRGDSLIRPLEWALANGSQCSFSFVACGKVEVLTLARSAYLQFISPFRVDSSPCESSLFVLNKVPLFCRTAHDEQWLLGTPLSQTRFFQALPLELRGRILSRGRHRRLRRGEWLCHYQSPIQACHLVLRGTVGAYTDSIFCAEAESSVASPSRPSGERSGKRGLRHHANPAIGISKQCQTLPRGTILGEYGLALGEEDEKWPYGVCSEEDCSLLELTRDKVRSTSLAYMEQMRKSITSSIPLQTLERVIHICKHTAVEKRSIDHLEVLSTFLKKYKQFCSLDSHVCLELCQWLYFREIEVGEVVGEMSSIFCIVLKGELALSILHEDAELNVLTVSLWGCLGEIEQNGGSAQNEDSAQQSTCTFKATKLAWLMCIDKDRVARIISRSQKGMADRDRAIITLRHTPPLYRVAADIEMLERLVSGNPFYAQLEKQVREEVCRSMTWSGFDPLMPIVRQGDDADRCFVLLKGSVGVWIGFDKPKDSGRRRSNHGDHRDQPLALKKAAGALLDASRSQKEKGEEKAIELASGFLRKRRIRKKGKNLKAIIKVLGSKLSSAGNASSFLTELPSPSEEAGEANHSPKSHSHHTIVIDPHTGGPRGGQLVKVLGEGECFGEAGLLRSEKRNATIVAREHCDCGVIHKSVFNRILRAAYMKQLKQRADFLEKHLPKPPPKSTARKSGKHGSAELEPEIERGAAKAAQLVLSSEEYEHLAGFFSKHTETRGKTLCSVGKPCPHILVIKEGTCKIFHHSGPQSPQEIGELGVGQILGAASHILGHGVEPYRVVCASAQVELLRMEPNDVKNRIPATLLEAISNAERDRQARLEQRACLLESRREVRLGSLVPRRWFKDRWLSGPFMRHKHYALMDDLGKCSLMRRMFSEWEPPGPEEDTAMNRSILHYHLDDFVTDEDILKHDHVEDISKVKQLLALPWHNEGNTNDGNVEHSRNGRSHRRMLVKRHLAEQANESKVSRALTRYLNESSPEKPKSQQGKPRPQSAPGMNVSPWGVPLGKASITNSEMASARNKRYVDVVMRAGSSMALREENDQDQIVDFAFASVGSGDVEDSTAFLAADMHSLRLSPCASRSSAGRADLPAAPTPAGNFNRKSPGTPLALEDNLESRLHPSPASKAMAPINSPRRAPPRTPLFEDGLQKKPLTRPMSAQLARDSSPLVDIAVKTNRPMTAEPRGFFDEEPCVRNGAEIVSPLDDVLISRRIRPLSAEEGRHRRVSPPKRFSRRHSEPSAPNTPVVLMTLHMGMPPRMRAKDIDIASSANTVPLAFRPVPSPMDVDGKLQGGVLHQQMLENNAAFDLLDDGPPIGEDTPEGSSVDLHLTPAQQLSATSIDLPTAPAPYATLASITSSALLHSSSSKRSSSVEPMATLTPPEPCDVVGPESATMDLGFAGQFEFHDGRSTSPCPPVSHELVVRQPPIERDDCGLRPRRLPGALNARHLGPHGKGRRSNSGNQCRPPGAQVAQHQAPPGSRRAHQFQSEVTCEISPPSKITLCALQCFARGEAYRQMQRNVDRSGTLAIIAKNRDTRNKRGPVVGVARAEVEAARRKAGR